MQKFHQGSFAACILGLALPKTIVHPFSSAYLELVVVSAGWAGYSNLRIRIDQISHCRGHHSITFTDSKEPGRDTQRQTILHPQYHCCGPILHICPLQNLQALVFPHKGCNTTPGPSAGHILPELVQLGLGWTLSLQINLECSSVPRLQPRLASCCRRHPIQDGGAGLQGCQRNCTHLPQNNGQTTWSSESTLMRMWL